MLLLVCEVTLLFSSSFIVVVVVLEFMLFLTAATKKNQGLFLFYFFFQTSWIWARSLRRIRLPDDTNDDNRLLLMRPAFIFLLYFSPKTNTATTKHKAKQLVLYDCFSSIFLQATFIVLFFTNPFHSLVFHKER